MTRETKTRHAEMTSEERQRKSAKKPGKYQRALPSLAVRSWWKREWLLPLTLFLALRLVSLALGYVAATDSRPEPVPFTPVYTLANSLLHQDRFSQSFVNIWEHWDTAWYLKVAAFGYASLDGSISFYPLYPLLIGGLERLTDDYLLAALIISSLAALAVFILFFEVARAEGLNVEQAGSALLFLAFFPSAFFLFAAYTESLFLALALGAWLAARRKRWGLAGLLGGLAALTRLQGVLLTPVLAWAWAAAAAGEAGLLSRQGRRRVFAAMAFPTWAATLVPALAFGAHMAYLKLSGLGFIPANLMRVWEIRTVMPWTGVWLFLQRLFTIDLDLIDYVDLSLLILVTTLLVVGLWRPKASPGKRLDSALSLYAWSNLALLFMRGTPPYLLDSFNRYLLSIFPAFLVLARMRSRPLRIAVWVVSFGLQALLLAGFLDWQWIA